jgi:hypothetical protein
MKGDFVEPFSFVRKLLICRKFNTCLKNDQFVKSFADQGFCAFAGISSTELSTGQYARSGSFSFGEDEQISRGELAVAEGADAYVVTALLQVKRAVEDEPEFEGAAEEVSE